MITLAIPLKNCKQCSHYRGGYCYGFGTAKQVFSESEAILCGNYTPLGQVQIGPIDSLGGQLAEYQIPSGLISTLKLADLAVTVDKLGLSSVIDSKVAAGAGIVESKLNLDFSTSDLDADIQTRLLAATYLAHDHSLADPTQVDFNNLLNKYTDADAVAAVEAESTLVLPGTLQVATKIGIGKAPSYGVDIRGVNAVDVTLNDERYNDASYGIAWYMKKARGTVAVPVIVNDNDFLYELIGYGHDGTAFIAAAKIEYKVDGTPGTNDMPGKILFSTTPDGGITPALAMTIDSQQRMSIMDNLLLQAGKTVDGVDVSAEPARISTEIDSDITTHKNLASAHHTAYTDAMALAAVDEHLVIGLDNAVWINCPYEGAEFVDGDKMHYTGAMEAYYVGGAGRYVYSVPLPTTRGGKSLYINGTRVSLSAANSSNRVYETNLYGMGDTTATELDSDETNKNLIDLWEDTSMGNENLGGYDAAKVILKTAIGTAGSLKIQYVTVRYYYA